MDLLDRLGAVVVGGGSGIGRGTALALAAEGMRVLVADIDVETAEATRDEIIRRGGDATAAYVDATDEASLAKLTARAEDLGGVRVLIHTVGVHTNAPLTTADENLWAWFIEFHLMSAVRVVRAFLPLLRGHDGGSHIVVTSSMSGLLALPAAETGGTDTGVYTALKHAIVGYGEMLRMEVAPEGIGVSVLCPGAVVTNLGSTTARHRPARFGGPLPDPMAGRTMSPDMIPSGMLQHEAVGPYVVRGIRANRAYIITHTEMADQVLARQQRLLDDIAFFATP
ncbi:MULTISPECIES: SDR family oxidoreductase [unclassified Pseudofrankia]|uniref:SDR family oxidoreductase n=1 Tax=unclassified Pseudofrankia TaxID=2994372 RepID=UPI0008DA8CCF|nr:MULTISPECIES: SDR family oxidoreductase [unclassified Pseudofrankia]MDT3445776.1 SDR family oxidoreductase [Pseudofrankia sp. BMG5.37]OHV62783.1 short-chain dehydrogenase [Pseudofrankia sp. BMG5.36]